MSEPASTRKPPNSHALDGAVRYPLDPMLREVERERGHSARARELVDQNEILKIFEHAGDHSE